MLLLRGGASAPFSEIAWSDLPHAVRVLAITAAAVALYTTLGFIVTMTLMLFALIAFEGRNLIAAAVYSLGVSLVDLCAVHHRAEDAARAGHPGLLKRIVGVGNTFDSLLLGFSVALRPDVLWYGFLGCLVGTLVGVLPGIGPLSGISILLPVTFGLDATKAIMMLAGIYYGSQYGGSTTSILMRIPGEASSVMTCIDGYAMAQEGPRRRCACASRRSARGSPAPSASSC